MRCSVNLLSALALMLGGPSWAACPTPDLLARLALMSKLPEPAVAAQLADDALLGPYARAHYPGAVHQPSRVGSSHQRQVDEQWLSLVSPFIGEAAKAARQAAKFDGALLRLGSRQWQPADLDGLNLQQRLALQQGDQALLEALLWQQATLALAPTWLANQGWDKDKVACARALVENRLDRVWLMQHLGLSDDPHQESPVLRQLAKEVTPDQIALYYRRHQDDFRQLAAVDARFFEGETQDSLVSLSPEPQRLARQDAQGDVLRTLAFVTPAKGRSAVIRLPSGRFGQVEVLARHYQLLAADSESVAFTARQAIAREKAKANWQALLQQLRREAK